MKFRIIPVLLGFVVTAFSQTLTVTVDKQIAPVQPTMWGIFFEDINFAGDGGLYPELVKNKSFEFDLPMMGWKEFTSDRFSLNKKTGSAIILNRGEGHENNPRYAKISVNASEAYSLVNEGFRGMGVKQGSRYTFSVWMQSNDAMSIRTELLGENDVVIGTAMVKTDSKEWKKYTAELNPSSTYAKAKLRITFVDTGILNIDQVSLFPTDTWKNRPGGLRKDLVQLLYDLKPGFLRFPGGCIVEGRDLSQRYQWKKTVGAVDQRELLINRWNTEFAHRPAPDYYQSFGLGFYEYFLLSEDIGASPLPVLGCGMACQFNTGELVPMDQLDPYVQDALDLIEFANGPITSKWGKLRNDMGHPASFNMKMIGVGNEQWGTEYIERYRAFEKAIKSKYPDITIVSSAGPFPDGELFDYAWDELKQLKASIVDEHYYKKPEWFFQNSNRYDKYDRNGPKIFAGEYAAQSVATASPENKNNWLCALSEAAFMTGLERNADVVYMTSYAPLFGHAEGWQWTPDLIWFDNLKSYGTPNYYVQKLFSNNAGTHLLSIADGGKNVNGEKSLYASAVWDEKAKEIVLKIVNASNDAITPVIELKGSKKLNAQAKVVYMKGNPDDVNSFSDPTAVKLMEETVAVSGKTLRPKLSPMSLTVIRIKSN